MWFDDVYDGASEVEFWLFFITYSARKVKQGIDNVVQHHVTSTHSETRVHESRLIPVCLWGEQKE